jgi:hypothetical protein
VHSETRDRHQPRKAAKRPEVRRLTPSTGTSEGGTEVVIKGRNLTGVKKVLFGGSRATDVVAKNARKIVVRTPPHAAGTAQVRVVTKQGRSRTTRASRFDYQVPVPVVSHLSPQAGPTAGGTTVTLTGRGLAGASDVRFGSTRAASVHVESSTRITVTSPSRAAGPVDVTVTTAGGSAKVVDAFTFVAPPTLTAVSPDSGPSTGATVTLTGSEFLPGTEVTFGGLAAADVTLRAPNTGRSGALRHASGSPCGRSIGWRPRSISPPAIVFRRTSPSCSATRPRYKSGRKRRAG